MPVVNTVNPLARSIAALRAALAQGKRTAPRGRVGSADTTDGSRKFEPTSAEVAASELALLPQRLMALLGDTAERDAQALRLFIRAVLVDEFQGGLDLAPDFNDLVERAAVQLESSEEFSTLTREALGDLMAGKPPALRG